MMPYANIYMDVIFRFLAFFLSKFIYRIFYLELYFERYEIDRFAVIKGRTDRGNMLDLNSDQIGKRYGFNLHTIGLEP
jgi:hypothetical protein